MFDGTKNVFVVDLNPNVNFRHICFMYPGIADDRESVCSTRLPADPYLNEDATLNRWFVFSVDSRKSLVPGLSLWFNRRDDDDIVQLRTESLPQPPNREPVLRADRAHLPSED